MCNIKDTTLRFIAQELTNNVENNILKRNKKIYYENKHILSLKIHELFVKFIPSPKSLFPHTQVFFNYPHYSLKTQLLWELLHHQSLVA